MLASVDLDHEAACRAKEIDDEGTKDLLPTEFEAAKAAITQYRPHAPLGFGRLMPHCPCTLQKKLATHN